MRIDHDRREVRAEKAELRDHSVYLRAKEWQTQHRYRLVIEPPYAGPLVPQNALIVPVDELHDGPTYARYKAQALAENKVLWPVAPRQDEKGNG